MQITTNTNSLLQVLQIQSFRLLWLIQIVTQVTFNLLTFILGVYIYEQFHSNTMVSLLYLTVGLPASVFGLVSGVIVDQIQKKKILIVTTFIRGIFLMLMFFLRQNLILVFMLMALMSAVSQFFVPAEAVLIPRFVPKNLLLSANSLFIMTFYTAIIGGFALGGPVYEAIGVANLLVLSSLIFLISSSMLFFLPKSHEETTRINFGKFWQDLTQGLKFIFQHVLITQAILLITLSQAVIAVFVTLGPGFVDKILALKLTDASLIILGPAALGMLFGALAIGSFGTRFRKRTLILTGIYLSAFLLLFLAALIGLQYNSKFESIFEDVFQISIKNGFLPISMLCFFILGVANSLIDVSCNSVLQEKTSESMRGKVYGVLQTLINGVSLLPVILSGILADLFGVGRIIFFLGTLLFLSGLYASRSSNRNID